MHKNKYDYIFAGGGMSAFTLVFLINQSSLRDKQILIVDRDLSVKNDKTWCFWEKETNIFEQQLYKKWDQAIVDGVKIHQNQDISPYQYKMLRSGDFFQHIHQSINQNPSIHLLEADITAVKYPMVETSAGAFQAEYVFTSYFLPDQLIIKPEANFLWQHFLGWEIKTQKPVFQPDIFTYMDFSIAQIDGFCFVYVLPFNEMEALIEYTVFSPDLWPKQKYREQLQVYMERKIASGSFEVIREEFGKIPMTDQQLKPPASHPKNIHIGTMGGTTKPSSGYTFLRNLHFCQDLVHQLEQKKVPQPMKFSTRHLFYDQVLLNVLNKNRLPGQLVFQKLFEKNQITQIMKFLDEETYFGEDLKIMNQMPKWPFMVAFFQELYRKMLK
ncbi:MAG: lycopene cyclase family protein [Candidatus Cyclobacteriaceae bacterium M3_2C_046]